MKMAIDGAIDGFISDAIDILDALHPTQ